MRRPVHKQLNILMISHHRRHKAFVRSQAMATQLVKRGHQVTLMVISEKRRIGFIEDRWESVRIIETPDLLWGRLRSGWDLWDVINRLVFCYKEREKYDLIHCFETRPATIYPALYYSNRFKVPFLTDWNDWYGRGGLIDINRPGWYRVLLGWLETFYEEAFRARAAGTTVISTALEHRAAKLGIPSDHICKIPGGSFPNVFRDRSSEECRKHVGLSFTGPILGFSSFDSHLDLGIVFKALAIIAQKYPYLKLIITGHIKKSIVELAKTFGVDSHLYLAGCLPFEELPWVLGCADVFVLPFPNKIYNIGRWPNKICDYMALGRPTVSNPYGDIKALFENYSVGLLANYDPEDFCRQIVYLIENPGVAKQLGREARRVAETQFNWQVLTDTLERFYYEVLNVE